MKRRLKELLLIGLLFLIINVQVNAMGIFDFLNVCVVSEINGVVTHQGNPVSDARVTLNARVVFNNSTYSVETKTDQNGRFHFDQLFSKSVNTILPSAKMVDQKIHVYFDNEEYEIWDITKNNYEVDGELNYFFENERADKTNVIPLDLKCELTNERRARVAPNNEFVTVKGICSWVGEDI